MFNFVKDDFDENSDDILASINKMLENNYSNEEIIKIIEREISKKKAELEEENEIRIRKIVDEILKEQNKKQDRKAEGVTSQILATLK